MSKKDKPEREGKAKKPGPQPRRLNIDQSNLDDSLGRIVRAGKPESKDDVRWLDEDDDE